MDYNPMTAARIDDLTRPQSKGVQTNPHVVPYQPALKPDYEKMRELTQGPAKQDPPGASLQA